MLLSRWHFIVFLLFSCSGVAQTILTNRSLLHFEHYLQPQGMSGNLVHALTTEPYGFTWIGTEDGLNRFDGYNFKIFRRKLGEPNSLSWNNISTLSFDSATNLLWIGTIRKGISIYNRITDSFYNIPLSITAKASNEWVNHISFVGNNAWIAADSGTVIIDRFSLQIRKVIRTGGMLHRIISNGTHTFFYFDNGNVWIINENFKILTKLQARDLFNAPGGFKINDVIRKPDGFYIITNQGCYIMKGLKIKPSLLTVKTRLRDHTRSALTVYLQDSRGREWIAIKDSGLLVKLPGDTIFQHHRYNPLHPLSVSDNNINCIAEDTKNNIWIGTQKGLNRLLKYPGWVHSYLNDGTEQSVMYNRLQTVYSTDNNILYLGSKTGIYIINKLTGSTIKAINLSAVQHQRFYFVRHFDDNKFLVSSYAGIQMMEKKSTGYVLSYTREYPELDSLMNRRISTIARISTDEYLLGGIHAGCWYWNRKSHQLYSISNHPDARNTNYNVYHIVGAGDSFWIATNKSLYTWRAGRAFITPYSLPHPFNEPPHINSLALLNNKLWMAFTSEGVGCLDVKNNKLKIYNTDNLLRNNISYSIMADAYDRIWVSGASGISVILPEKNIAVYYNKQDGFQGDEFTNFCYWQNNGLMYFGGNNGLSVIDTRAYDINTAPPEIFLSNVKVLVENKYIDWPQWNNLRLTHDQNHLNFVFAVNDVGVRHRISYMYRLLPLEKQWISNGSLNSIFFTNIPPGYYTLQVKPVNAEIGTNTKPFIFPFSISPAWYQTLLFKFLVVLFSVLVIFMFVRMFFKARLKEQRINYERQLAIQSERQRISAEIHDDIGAGLSGVRLLTELTGKKIENKETQEEVNKIYSSITELSSKMREVIWTLNTTNDTLENLLLYINRQARLLLDNSTIHLTVHIPGEIPAINIPGEKRTDIYLSVKEALHNALKHSGAEKIELMFTLKNNNLYITVSDNGTGIGGGQPGDGNGMLNMKKRMDRLAGNIDIKNHNGTAVVFSIPLK